MPIYEYECEKCGNRFDRMQSMRAEPVRQCPACAGLVHKIFHPAGIIFKGSGWYITDSRKATSSAVTGETQSNGGETKPEAKSNGGETKPEAKSNGGETKTESPPAAAKAEIKSESKAETK